MMTNLKEKTIQWLAKLRQGDKKFCGILPVENEWYFISDRHAEKILSLKIAIDGGAGLRPEHNYDISKPNQDNFRATVIIKDDCKMIVTDCNGEFGFGMADVESPANAIFIYVRTASVHSFIFGYQKACSVNMIHALSTEMYDAVAYCMDDMFSSPESKVAFGEEVNGFGGVVGDTSSC